MQYETLISQEINGTEIQTIIRTDENGQVFHIPNDPANSDFQRYLRWLEDPTAEAHSTEIVPPSL